MGIRWEYVGKKAKSGNMNAPKKKASDSRDNKYLNNGGVNLHFKNHYHVINFITITRHSLLT